MVLGFGPDNQLVRIVAAGEVGPTHDVFEQVLGVSCADRFDVVDPQFQPGFQRVFGFQLVDQLLGQFVIGRRSKGDQSCIVSRAIAELHPWQRPAQDVVGRNGADAFHVIDDDLRPAFSSLFDDLVNGRPNREVIAGNRPGHQTTTAFVDREPGVGDDGFQKGYNRLRIAALDRIDRHGRTVLGVFAVHGRDGGLDLGVVLGRGSHHQAAASQVDGDCGVGDERSQDELSGSGIGLAQTVDLRRQLVHRRQVSHNLLEDRMVLRPGPNDELARIGARGELSLGHDTGQHLLSPGRTNQFHVIDTQLESLPLGGLTFQLVDQLLAPLVVGFRPPGDEFRTIRAPVVELHARKRPAQDVVGGQGAGMFQVIDDDFGGPFTGLSDHLVNGSFDSRLIGRIGPHHQVAAVLLHGDSGVGHDGAQEGRHRVRIDLLDRIDDQSRFVFGIQSLHLVESLQDLRVVLGHGADDQAAADQVGRDRRIRHQRTECQLDGSGIGRG